MVQFLFNIHGPNQRVMKQRRTGDAGRIELAALIVALEYNKMMWAVDHVGHVGHGSTLVMAESQTLPQC